MAYAFNEDRSKVDVYTEDEIDAMHIVDKETIDAKNALQDQAIADETAARILADSTESGARSAADTLINARIDTLVDHGTGGIEVRQELWTSVSGVISGSINLSDDPDDYDCLELVVGDSPIRKIARIQVTGGVVDISTGVGPNDVKISSVQITRDGDNLLVSAADELEYTGSWSYSSSGTAIPKIYAVYGIKYAQDCSAEVADIRVANDGTVYPTAGDAVRSNDQNGLDYSDSLYSYIVDKLGMTCVADGNFFTAGYYINQNNGVVSESSTNRATLDFIPVVPGESYFICGFESFTPIIINYRICFYDKAFKFISGYFIEDHSVKTAPSNAKFMKASCSTNYVNISVMRKSSLDDTNHFFKLPDTQKFVTTAPKLGEINLEMLSFMKPFNNYCDWTDCVVGMINGNNGNINSTYGSYRTTRFIRVDPDTVYYGNSSIHNIAIYDSNKRFIRFLDPSHVDFSINTGSDGAYVRISGYYTSIANVTFFKGSIPGERIDPDWTIPLEALDVNGMFPIPDINLDIFDRSNNIVNPDNWIDGKYVNQTNGELSSNASYHATDFIEIEPGESYEISNDSGNSSLRYAFYTKYKTYVSGDYPQTTTSVVSAPSSAKYIRASIAKTVNLCIAKGSGTPSYQNFYFKIRQKYLDGGSVVAPIFNLPKKVYALVGYETNIYFENIVENWDDFDWNVTCNKGLQLERGFRVTPTANDVGTYALSIDIKNSAGVSFSFSTSLIIVGLSAGSGESAKVMILGDSTTNNGTVISKLNENFSNDLMNISTIGTRGVAPNKHEGRGGWTFYSYFTNPGSGDVQNPWYNPSTQTFDANYYFAETGIDKPDWFFINLGINDVFGYTNESNLESKISEMVSQCDAMIASMNFASPDTKIGICITIPPNHSQDAYGKQYACGQTRNRYKHNNTLWAKTAIDEYDNRESEGIYLVPINLCLDTVYNMGMEEIKVNARNNITYMSPIGNGGVHPVESGYWQIADVYTAFIKYWATQD